MSSAQLLTKVPFYGRVVDASNRGMSSALAHTRFELAKNFIDAAGGIDNVTKTFSTKELADLGEVLNTITGRGGKRAASLTETLAFYQTHFSQAVYGRLILTCLTQSGMPDYLLRLVKKPCHHLLPFLPYSVVL